MQIKLSEIVRSPVAFRKALLVECGRSKPLPLDQVLDDWQRQDFETLDHSWRAIVRRGPADGAKLRAYLERPRGHSKTSDLAAMVVWALISSERQITMAAAAADLDQAKLLRDSIERLVRLNPWLSDIIQVQALKVSCEATGSTLTIIPSDEGSSYGMLVDVVLVDEITHWKEGAEKFWDSLISTAAKKTCLVVVISNAGTGMGEPGGDNGSWQWRIREFARLSEDWYFHSLDGPRASWISQAALDEQRKILVPLSKFFRLWFNRWSTSEGDAIAEAEIDAAVTLDKMADDRSADVEFFGGLDLGISRDGSAFVVVARERNGARSRLAHVRTWKPEPGANVSIEEVHAEISATHKRLRMSALNFDPWQAIYLAELLRKEGVPMRATRFQGKGLEDLANAIVQAFRDGNIELTNDADLLRAVRSLRTVETASGVKLKAKRNKHGHADEAFGLALALLAAEAGEVIEPGIFVYDEATHGRLPTIAELVGTATNKHLTPAARMREEVRRWMEIDTEV